MGWQREQALSAATDLALEPAVIPVVMKTWKGGDNPSATVLGSVESFPKDKEYCGMAVSGHGR